MKNAVTIFFPNGQQTEYVMGINDVDVISHDENFQHLCQKALFVVKQKEVSYLVDKETFNKAEVETADMAAGHEEGENLQLMNPAPKKGGINVAKALAKKKKQVDEDDEWSKD